MPSQEEIPNKQIVLEDFSSMDLSGTDEKAEHYLLQNVVPDYAYNAPGVQEEQFAPLASALTPALVQGALDGNVVTMIPSPVSSYSVLLVTQNRHIYSIDSFFDLGQPLGSGTGDSSGRLAIFAGKLVYTNSASTSISLTDLVTRAQTTITSALNTGGVRFVEAFLDFCAVVDGDSGQNNRRYVKKLTTSFSAPLGTGIDVGLSYQIMGLKNYANKYLAIAAHYGSVASFIKNQLFLWNGTAATYNYAIPLPGKFLDMDVVDGALYVAVAIKSNQTAVYVLSSNQTLKFMFFSQYSTISAIFNAQNNLVAVTSNGVLVWYMAGKDEYSYYLANGSYQCGAAGGPSNNIYLASAAAVYYYPASGIYAPITYISQYLKPEGGAGQVASVDVYYDTPPVQAGDQILVNLYAVDETGPAGTLANSNVQLLTITPSNILNNKFTRLDGKGLYFNKLSVRLQTQLNFGTTWNPIIRKIVINYQPVIG